MVDYSEKGFVVQFGDDKTGSCVLMTPSYVRLLNYYNSTLRSLLYDLGSLSFDEILPEINLANLKLFSQYLEHLNSEYELTSKLLAGCPAEMVGDDNG